jgi:hypothetical protein
MNVRLNQITSHNPWRLAEHVYDRVIFQAVGPISQVLPVLGKEVGSTAHIARHECRPIVASPAPFFEDLSATMPVFNSLVRAEK